MGRFQLMSDRVPIPAELVEKAVIALRTEHSYRDYDCCDNLNRAHARTVIEAVRGDLAASLFTDSEKRALVMAITVTLEGSIAWPGGHTAQILEDTCAKLEAMLDVD
jgi:hypothetical protein